MATSKVKKIVFGVSTTLVVLVMLGGGIMDLLRGEDVLKAMDTLGYPHYLPLILGVAKLLGVAAWLAPGFPRLKEWAYAGFTIDMVGGAASHIMADDLANLPPALIVLALVLVSYFLRPKTGYFAGIPKR